MNERPTREEAERDEATRRPFVWQPTEAELIEAAHTDPFSPLYRHPSQEN